MVIKKDQEKIQHQISSKDDIQTIEMKMDLQWNQLSEPNPMQTALSYQQSQHYRAISW